MKYRMKHVTIEALKWTGDNFSEALDFLERAGGAMPTKPKPGDWIIRDGDGGLFPCNPDVFEKIYEPA